jgi:hypothetical protein
MNLGQLRSFAKPLSFAALAAIACSSDDEGGKKKPSGPSLTFQEDGVYHYLLGVDYGGTGRFVTGGAHEIVKSTDREKADEIDPANYPSRLHAQLGDPEYQKWDASITAGETDWKVFASTWWAQSNNGIAKRWAGDATKDYNDLSNTDGLGPVEKYDLLFYPGQQKEVATVEHWDYRELLKPEAERGAKHKHDAATVAGPATKWELENHGLYQTYAHPDSWWGHCNGWSSYATSEPGGAPARDITVKLDSDGKVYECDATDSNCIHFRMGDIEALMTELYFSDKATFSGRRCNTDPEKIERDEFGRPKDAACRDLNPGAFHIGVTGLLNRGAEQFSTKKMGKPAFVIDHNWDWEVWNFPLVKFEISEQKEISAEDANKAIGATGSGYKFNENARKFVAVKLKYWMVSDGVADSEMLQNAFARGTAPKETELNYVLELDDTGKILGGEWSKDPAYSWSQDNKELHPDFIWMGVENRGAGEDDDDMGGDDDNPYVSYKKARALLDCANDPATCQKPGTGTGGAGGAAGAGGTGGTTGGPASCVDHCSAQSEDKSCWCDSGCKTYGDCCSDYLDVCTGSTGGAGGAGGSSTGGTGGVSEPTGCTPATCGTANDAKEDGKACYCDSQCANYGDCCSNKVEVCGE